MDNARGLQSDNLSVGEERGRRNMDKFQESFRDFKEESQLVELEIGNEWFTWNN